MYVRRYSKDKVLISLKNNFAINPCLDFPKVKSILIRLPKVNIYPKALTVLRAQKASAKYGLNATQLNYSSISVLAQNHTLNCSKTCPIT